MSSEFAARLGWIEELGRAEAKVLGAALQAVLEIPGEEIGGLSESESELLDNLTEGIWEQEAESEKWMAAMGEADREAVGTCLLWLQYPEAEAPDISEAQWRRLEEVYIAVAERTASLMASELELV